VWRANPSPALKDNELMIHETLIHQLSVKALCKKLELSPRDLDVLLLLQTSRSLSTPSIHQLLSIRKSEMNRRLGPKLIELGWLKSEQVNHSRKSGLPTNRWWVPEDKQMLISNALNEIRRDVLTELGAVYNEDLCWLPHSEETV
jgi:predicted transcriptional regulator